MDLPVFSLICILVVKIYHVYSLSPCPESLSTVANVNRCPRNKCEWDIQASKKACSKVPQSCVKPEEFVYHCLINEYMNMTIEVCAPPAIILGHKCAEFNEVGAVVQDNVYAKCNDSDPPCPFRYNSTESYEYQRCYSYIKSSEKVKPCLSVDSGDQSICSCNENLWLAVSLVFIIFSCGCGGILLYKCRNVFHRTSNRKPEETRGDPLMQMEEDDDDIQQIQLSQETFEGKTWVYSIYFGDKHCGVAYLDPNSPENIKSFGDHEIIGVLVTKDGEVIKFGDEARKMFTDSGNDCSEYIFLDHDELDIEYWNQKLLKLPSIKIIEIYQNIIGFLVKKIFDKIAGHGSQTQEGTSCESGSCLLCNMHCVITVPHHWIEKVKHLRAAFDSTMKILHKKVKKERLHIKLREVAISPYIHEVNAPVICLNFNVDNLTFKKRTIYANLHVGSKYFNLTFLKAVNSKSPDTIIGKPDRQKWQTTPEEQFVTHFEALVTPSIFHEWKSKYESEYISLIRLLEEQKIKMRETMDEDEYIFQLPSKLFELLEEGGLSDLEDRVANQGVEVRRQERGCSIIFKWSLLKDFFADVKENTKLIIKRNKKLFKDRKVRCVIMTGSYSKMKLFLHAAETEWFNEFTSPVTVVVPVHIGSTYAMGAAYFFNKYPKWIFYDLIYNPRSPNTFPCCF